MSFKTPILVTSSAVWAYAVPQASVPATAAMLKRRFIVSAPCLVLTLYAEIFVERFELGVQLGVRELVHDLSVFHDVIAIRDGRGEVKILLDVEARKNAAFLRAERDPGAGDMVRGAADELAVLEPHRALALADDAHDGFQRRGLAGAVAAEQRHHLSGEYRERRPVQDVGFAVPGLQRVDRKQRRRGVGVKHGRPPCRPRGPPGWPRPSRNRLRRGCGRGSAR